MKKKIKLQGVSASPFSGDCARQSQLNRSVDRLARGQRTVLGLPSSVVSHPPSVLRSQSSEIIISALFFACLIGCAYGVMAL